MTQLPGPLRLTPSFPFAGRSHELATLRALMPRVEGEGRRIALVAGEPGSGKSRLVREFAHEAAEDGTLVLHGACDAVVRTPYRPFVEALDHLVRLSDPGTLRADLGTTGGELTRLLPELSLRVGDLPSPVAADPDTERHRLHTAVTDLLGSVSSRRPVLIVVEDGHWADTPTLLLLRHLGRAAADVRMLLLATFRDTEAEVPEELSAALVDLRRSEDVVRIRLGGLSAEEIAEFVRGAAGTDLGSDLPDVARAIGELTDGNAFLVTELWRALIETGTLSMEMGGVRLTRPLSELGSPESVRELVSQRLARLAPGTSDLLEIAAVAGQTFDVGVLQGASSLSDDGVLVALDEAMRSGMIEEVSARRLVYRFTHELVRRALYDRLSAVRRANVHLRVGESFERVFAADPDRVLADLAYHFAAAAPLGATRRAVDYNVRAARAAQSALAFDEAVSRFSTALELGVDDPVERARLQLELGAANHAAGRATDALAAFAAAASLGRELGDAELFAEAAIGFERACWRPGIADRGAVELLEEAVAALGEGDSRLRAGLLGGIARALAFRGEHARAAIVRTHAIEMSRRIDDRRGLAGTLIGAYWSRGTTSLEEIHAMLAEGIEIADELGDIEVKAEAMEWRIAALIAGGDLESARRELAIVLELGSRMGQPFIIHVAEHYAALIALCDGRLAEAEAAAERSREWSRLLTGRDPSGIYGVQMFSIRREQGRLAELGAVVRVVASRERPGGAWRPGLAALLAEIGMTDEAGRELRELARLGLDGYRESLWIASLTYLTDASAAVGDQEMASIVYPELEAHAGTNVMVGHGVACYGSADRYLGMLSATLGEWEAAERHFEAAADANVRMGAWTWLAHTDYEHGRMLVARGRAEDRRLAAPILSRAAALGERIGMPALVGRVRALGSTSLETPRLPDGISPREAQILRLVARGLSNREIGAELTISEHTAANHIRSILRKTGCANRTEAASYAHRQGLAET
jgi:predicted ATPase/DNA-binding CsgD family transcriptional regulator